MYRPVCLKCQKEYRVIKNDVWVVYLDGKPPKPASMIMANLLECPMCKMKLVSDFAYEATYKGDEKFNDLLQNLRDSKTDTVIYCFLNR